MGGLLFPVFQQSRSRPYPASDYGRVGFGEYAAHGISDRMRVIADDFQRAGIPTELFEDLAVVRWQKLVWNIPYNGLSVVLEPPPKNDEDPHTASSSSESLGSDRELAALRARPYPMRSLEHALLHRKDDSLSHEHEDRL